MLIQKSGYIPEKKASGYLRYIATREGARPLEGYLQYMAERRRSHGLFGADGAADLAKSMKELSEAEGTVRTFIFSLRREDAARLGYDTPEAWRRVLLANEATIAEALQILPEKLRWRAAFHDEGSHPHVHMVLWSQDGKQGFVTGKGIVRIRSAMTNTIFRDELTELYRKKDLAYKEVTREARQAMKACIARMQTEPVCRPELEQMILRLAQMLPAVKGKKQYGYLPKPMKALVNGIVDEIGKVDAVRDCYDVWNDVRDAMQQYYKDAPRQRLPLSEQKEFTPIRNIVIHEAQQLVNPERASEGFAQMQPELTQCVARLMRHVSRLFQEQTVMPANPAGVRIDSRRRKRLLEKRLALGHKPDDHEQQM